MTQIILTDHEAIAFADAARAVPQDQPTACQGWTAHDVLAHVIAGGGELTRLVQRQLDGKPPTSTIPFDQREPAFRAIPHHELLEFISVDGIFNLLGALSETETDSLVEFTGWAMTADSLALHVRSELAVHRWDLTGSDPTSVELLGQRELTAHAVEALNSLDSIVERGEARTRSLLVQGGEGFEVRLRVDGESDVVIVASPDSTVLSLAEPEGDRAITTDRAGRLLMLWGRRPPPDHRYATDLDPKSRSAAEHWLFGKH